MSYCRQLDVAYVHLGYNIRQNTRYKTISLNSIFAFRPELLAG